MEGKFGEWSGYCKIQGRRAVVMVLDLRRLWQKWTKYKLKHKGKIKTKNVKEKSEIKNVKEKMKNDMKVHYKE